VIRTYAQNDVEEFAQYSKIPTINALTDDEHPCQILTDIFTFEELTRQRITGKVVTFVGDGACNVPISWLWAAAHLGFELRIAAPRKYWPAAEIIQRASKGASADVDSDPSGKTRRILIDNGVLELTEDLHWAARKADLVYTDVWVSMGKEAESGERIKDLTGYQINDEMLRMANPEALVMHCLPAYRGKEITEQAMETHADTIFSQAENRLHTQKAIISWLIRSSNAAV
jgi:ornithine carbamoyltransferase